MPRPAAKVLTNEATQGPRTIHVLVQSWLPVLLLAGVLGLMTDEWPSDKGIAAPALTEPQGLAEGPKSFLLPTL